MRLSMTKLPKKKKTSEQITNLYDSRTIKNLFGKI